MKIVTVNNQAPEIKTTRRAIDMVKGVKSGVLKQAEALEVARACFCSAELRFFECALKGVR